MLTMLLSIKPMYADKILQGEKLYEFRKIRCKKEVNKILFYATAPQSQVVGEAYIDCVLENTPAQIWKVAKSAAGITRKCFFEYYSKKEVAIAYKLKNVTMYDKPKRLSSYGVAHPPQSYVYIQD